MAVVVRGVWSKFLKNISISAKVACTDRAGCITGARPFHVGEWKEKKEVI